MILKFCISNKSTKGIKLGGNVVPPIGISIYLPIINISVAMYKWNKKFEATKVFLFLNMYSNMFFRKYIII
ncbi:hypothetical protein WG909_06650 [Peptostreptococcaceae bacterium AGR-M142]